MPTEKDTTGGVKKMKSERLPSAKIVGPVDSENTQNALEGKEIVKASSLAIVPNGDKEH
ncbi:hypothetical protein F2Q68_00034441 [Brassica cretica]|uniref:Uncharacterized protein n=1 Tax=Brassica cretica TaxID=69181 RepID=A0A8S9H8D5_BRACR|nr:hypothetical protein F2Q68_00034441 [Brassica cretica]KAF3487682.1 hypothetical protein F2Q69_00053229 [Brassica cretica]